MKSYETWRYSQYQLVERISEPSTASLFLPVHFVSVRWDSSDFLPRLRHLEKQLQDTACCRVDLDKIRGSWNSFQNIEKCGDFQDFSIFFPIPFWRSLHSTQNGLMKWWSSQGAIRKSSKIPRKRWKYRRTVQGRCCIHKKPKSRCVFGLKVFHPLRHLHENLSIPPCWESIVLQSFQFTPIDSSPSISILKRIEVGSAFQLFSFFQQLQRIESSFPKNHSSCSSNLSAYKTGFVSQSTSCHGGFSRTRPDGDGGCGSHWEITLEVWGSGSLPCESRGEIEKGGEKEGRVATRVIYSDSCHSIRLV